ncbi:hypothetical protein Pint_18258 [Pistacia integerrima]|uniref:Uncharacterized protein n=1 Tax=Pistacia integerrima TaxID=434235 RepID=A0ACC0Z1I3_9ROSI|nr:hypothetical protein Pint_18258 [Pistacia integerrima]
MAHYNGEVEVEVSVKPTSLSPSASFKARRPKPNDDVINLLHGSDPVRLELNRLENELRDKDRELGESLAEIKSLKNSGTPQTQSCGRVAAHVEICSKLVFLPIRDPVHFLLTDKLNKVDEKLKVTEALLESKNLEIKKINDEKKAALAAQFAAEATLRRVHAAQKDDEMPPIEAIITPLEAELKRARLEAAKLQEDNRALDRLTKSKEAALLETERTVQMALAKAAFVDDLQNKNQELMKQIEICQEENKIVDKMHRLKVAEVEKLIQSVRELEEAVLAGGAAANAVRDYQRKVQEMNEEKKYLEREVARAKVSANRVATVVANEWKDGNDKVMPGELQQLRDKLVVAERTAKAEAQLKEKYHLRFKVLEERLKASNVNSRTASEGRCINNGLSRCQSFGGAESFSRSSNGYLSKKAVNLQTGSLRSNSAIALVRNAKMSSRSFDGGSRSLDRGNLIPVAAAKDNFPTITNDQTSSTEITITHDESMDGILTEKSKTQLEDHVSGVLYDLLQKEVITLRKACHEKDQSLKDKDDAIEILAKKVDTLNKAMEVESKKMRREVAAMEKEVAAMRVGKEHDQRTRRTSAPKAAVTSPHLLSARNARN